MRSLKYFVSAILIFLLCISFNTAAFADKNSTIVITQWPPNSWDPAIDNAWLAQTSLLIYETLVVTENGKFIPRLATSYEKSDDAKVWTFKLRKGVKFHNGETFTAEAVKFSYDRTKRINKSPAVNLAAIQEIKVLDDYTVQFICKDPAPLDMLLAQPYGTPIMAPKITAEKGDEWIRAGNAVGTGPYKLISVEKDVQIVLEKFDDYWGGWKDNQYERAILKWIKEPSTRAQLLRGGELDLDGNNLPVDMLSGLKKHPDLEIVVGDLWKNFFYFMHTQKPPTDDINVRKAIIYAINYDELVEQVFGISASKNLTPAPKSMYDYEPDLKTYKYDSEKAKELLKKSKYADQLAKGKLKLTMSNPLPELNAVGLYVQATLKKLGFDVEVDPTLWPMIWDKLKKKDTCPNLSLMRWGDYQNSMQERFGLLYHSQKDDENAFNWSFYNNPEFDKLYQEAKATEALDRDKARKLYVKMQQILLDDAASVFICDTRRVTVKRKEIKGYKINPAYNVVTFVYDLYH